MKLGAGTYTWSRQGLSLETAVQEIASLGIRYVDILGSGHGHPSNFSTSRRKELKRRLDDLGLMPSSMLALYEGNIANPDRHEQDRIMAYMEAVIEFCQILECRQILYKPGDKIIDVPNASAWENSVLFSRRLSALTKPLGIYLTFEIVPSAFALVQDIHQLEVMLDDVDQSNVLANLDLGHVALARDGREEVTRIAPRTIHLHLNDNDTFVHTNDVIGTGQVPTQAYVDALLDNGAEETCTRLGIELVGGIEIEVGDGSPHTALEINRMSRDYLLNRIPGISL